MTLAFPTVTVIMYLVSFANTELTTEMFFMWCQITYWYYMTAFWAPVVLWAAGWSY